MDYQLIALDLDGTLLNSRKEITEDTIQAVRTVSAAGKTVVFDTGRSIPELAEQIALLPEVHYAVYASGAGLYDIRKKKVFGLHSIPEAQVKRIMALGRTKDVMPQIITADRGIIQASHMENLEHFHMEVYRSSYEKSMTLVPDIYAYAETCGEPFLKINLYHAKPDEQFRTREQLYTPELELIYYSEVYSLECTASGFNKGTGLEHLCALLNIPTKACVAVGDADNDIPMLHAAGLGIAMGNAPDYVKTAADRVVSDLDHGGCAQAIMMLLDQ